MMNETLNILTPQEAADFLKIKLGTLYEWVHKRKIPYRKHGRLLRFEEKDLISWSDARVFKNNRRIRV